MAVYKEYDSVDALFDETFMNDYKVLKKSLCMRVFNKDNIPYGIPSQDIPHIKWSDLIISYSVEKKMYIDDELGRGYYMLKNSDMNKLGISHEQLYSDAEANMIFKNGTRLETIAKHVSRHNILSPIISIPQNVGMKISVSPSGRRNVRRHTLFETSQYSDVLLPETVPFLNPEADSAEDKNDDMVVISNRTMNFAAANMFIDNTIQKIYDRFKEDFYILPVSVHEVICLKVSHALNGASTEREAEEDLIDMVEQVNDKIITDDNDILSYSVYKYMHDERCTMIIN